MVKEQLTKERILADIRRSQLDHTPTAVTVTDNCIVWGSAAVAGGGSAIRPSCNSTAANGKSRPGTTPGAILLK